MKKRFIFSLPDEVFKKLRQKAFDRNISISLYVIQAIVMRLETEVD